MKHICKYCGEEFERKQKAQKYCNSCKAKPKDVLQGRIHNPDNPQICHYCGKTFFGSKRKYCNRNCAIKAYNDKPTFYQHKCELCGIEWESKARIAKRCKKCANKQIHTYICLNCGKEFHPKKKEYNKYCSRECCFEHLKANARGRTPRPKKPNKPKNIVTCEVCKKDFETNQPKAKYCSDECRRIAGVDRAYKKNTAISRNCKWCGTEFIPDHRASTYAYCCEEHKQLAIKEHEEKHGISKAKRKRIYLRDGCNCKLCGKPMRMDMIHTLGTSNPHPFAPTIDHIMPKSIAKQQGWTKEQIHDDSNLQAAHWRCNIDKGTKPMGEQLLLFG